jgi:transposase
MAFDESKRQRPYVPRPCKRKPRPDPEALRKLYEDDRLSIEKLTAMFGVSYWTAREWLIRDGVTLRAASNGLANKGKPVPTRAELEDLVHGQHLPLATVGERYGITGGCVARWLDQHGIARPDAEMTRFRGNIPRRPSADEIREVYARSSSLENVAKHFSVSRATLRRWCRTDGVAIRPDGLHQGRRYECSSGLQVRSLPEKMVAEWLIANGVDFDYEPRLPFHPMWQSDFLANGWYIEVWGMRHLGPSGERYEKRRLRKIKAYRRHNAPLVNVEYHDLLPGSKRWLKKLSVCLSAPDAPPSAEVDQMSFGFR